MLGLTIINIEISANTNGGIFSVKIPFNNGLNIIRADNSSGKSTCINAIAYGLGLEAILGPSRKRPFPKSLYEVIYDNKNDEKPYFVSNSFVSISIKNSKGNSAVLTRDIEGNNNKVTIESDVNGGDYFLGSAGNGVGSAISEKGFHHWLANFIGWNLPSVVTFDGKETTLYLECIFPLFFIEQKRGWSEIQANTPTQYNIKNLKKSVVEFCLAIDSFEHEKKIATLKNTIESKESEWNNLRSFAKSIADFNSIRLNKLLDLDVKNSVCLVKFSYLENNISISVEEQERSLKIFIEKLSKEVTSKTVDNEKLNSQIAVMRTLRREAEETSNSAEMIRLSISEVDSKLLTLKHDYNQYQQLNKLKKVGSINSDIDTRKCPICENDLYDTLGNSTVKRKPMTPDENIDFLKNQLDFFSSIKKKNIAQLQELQDKARLLNSRIDVENDKLSSLREEIDDINGSTKALLRETIQAEILLKGVLKIKEEQEKLNEQATRIYSTWSNASNSLKQMKKNSTDTDRGLVIRKLESIIKGNLTAFHFNHSAINSVSISHQTLRPEQEGYDIVAESSASDYIRIIWSYTLALLELAANESEIKHGGFVVFDEPRQHEASKLSFTNLIEKAAESVLYGGQVIFATSLDESELRASCVGKKVNLVCFNDYILTLASSK